MKIAPHSPSKALASTPTSTAFLTCAVADNLPTTLPLPPLTLRYDTVLCYACSQQEGYRQGACHLRLFWPAQGVPAANNPAVALVTEMPEFGGVSVTNGIEAIAGEISRLYNLHPRHTVLIEHYDDRDNGAAARLPGRINGEKFSCVTFGEMQPRPSVEGSIEVWSLRRPQWRNIGKGEVEALLGTALP